MPAVHDGGKTGVLEQVTELGKLFVVPLVERVDPLLREAAVDAVAQAAYHRREVTVARLIGALLGGERERDDDAHLAREQLEAFRHDGDDLARGAVDPDLLPDDAWGAGEHLLPDVVAENDYLVVADLAFGLGERAAELGHGPENREERRRRVEPGDAQRRSLAPECVVAEGEQGQRLEDLGLLAPVEVVGDAVGALVDADVGIDVVEDDEALAVGERQRAEQDGVDDAENGRVGADTERQGDERHPAEELVAREQLEAEPEVLQD